MNWGYKILITYVLFVCGITFLVVHAVNQKIDLVTPEYYAEELKFQDEIDEHERANQLSAPVEVDYSKPKLLLIFPAEFDGKKINGQLYIYYPADKDKDIRIKFETANRTFSTNLPFGIYGKHELHIYWESDTTNYSFEKNVFFP
ncbi:MAG: FixH family protein [Ferruginibacter sp.]